ncbi:beta-myrcene synthase [Artemisia annua]|uniref:Beta-myrcene synthase n=1 Tax=Artemisia annua TaxID=35608 RepID=A0A2U1NG40_ARTAN|nr:beta-myrcene synthase [Artemisia annua]
MASACFFSRPVFRNMNYNAKSYRGHICSRIYSSQSTSMAFTADENVVRRTANYEPTLWSYDHIQSLSSKYTGEEYAARANILKNSVKRLLGEVENSPSILELVNDLQRLGIYYHFEDEIRNALEMIYYKYYKTPDKWGKMDLNLTALGFRLLRQHGYQVPQEIFQNFLDNAQNLKPHLLEEIAGMLNLYEASYHAFEDETILDNARAFTTKYLKENLDKIDGHILSLVSHALEFPLHWRVPRVEAKWYIEVYEKKNGMNHILIELAKLDFDMVQAIHLEDLKHASRWWRNTNWDKKLSFARDRLVENFLWTIGFNYLPQFSHGRRTLTKVNALITTIDDVYDVFGTLDEIEQFTDATNRWDINSIEELPDYMKICFLGFYNTINEITYNALTNKRFIILPYLKKAWGDLFKSFVVEANWYQSGHIPTLEEYLENGCISISGPVILMHVHFITSISSAEEIMQCMEISKDIVRYSSLIFRLTDDLGTSSGEMERGDNPKSLQCYMHETGASEDEARIYMKSLIGETWKKLNKERTHASSDITREFIDFATNLVRMAQFMYGEGDVHGRPDVTKSHVLSLLFNPIQEI